MMSVTLSQLVPLPIESESSLKNFASFSLAQVARKKPVSATCLSYRERKSSWALPLSLVLPNRLLLLRVILFIKRVDRLFRLEDRLFSLLLGTLISLFDLLGLLGTPFTNGFGFLFLQDLRCCECWSREDGRVGGLLLSGG